jgi:hypothetical protein
VAAQLILTGQVVDLVILLFFAIFFGLQLVILFTLLLVLIFALVVIVLSP